MRIAVARGEHFPPTDDRDGPLLKALTRCGVDATSVVWGGPVPDVDAIVIGAAWDYTARYDEFVTWLRDVDARCALINSLPALLWSSTKQYLVDLQSAGVPTIPTALAALTGQPDDDVNLLRAVAETHDWAEIVVKGLVSASSMQLVRTRVSDLAQAAPVLAERIGAVDVVVQPFMPAITTTGEYSLVYYAGELHHAVLKRPAAGDFRVQSEYGGTSVVVPPPPDVLAVADAAWRAVPHDATYARLDVVGAAADHGPLLIEVELVEPELFHELHSASVDAMAAAVTAAAG